MSNYIFLAQSVMFDGIVSSVNLQINPLLHPAVYKASVSLRTRSVSSTVVHVQYGTADEVEVRITDGGILELRFYTRENSGISVY